MPSCSKAVEPVVELSDQDAADPAVAARPLCSPARGRRSVPDWPRPAACVRPAPGSASSWSAQRDGHLRDMIAIVADPVDDAAQLIDRYQVVLIDRAQHGVRGRHAGKAEPAHRGDHQERHRRRQRPCVRATTGTRPGTACHNPSRMISPSRRRDALRGAGADRGISLFGRRDRLAGWPGADRNVAGHLIVLDHRRHVGPHPIEIARLRPVLDQAVPWPPGLDGRPKVGECLRRHMRMADDVVRRADQFRLGEAADLDEDLIDEDDAARRDRCGTPAVRRRVFRFRRR